MISTCAYPEGPQANNACTAPGIALWSHLLALSLRRAGMQTLRFLFVEGAPGWLWHAAGHHEIQKYHSRASRARVEALQTLFVQGCCLGIKTDAP